MKKKIIALRVDKKTLDELAFIKSKLKEKSNMELTQSQIIRTAISKYFKEFIE